MWSARRGRGQASAGKRAGTSPAPTLACWAILAGLAAAQAPLKVPEGFEVVPAALPPLVEHPMFATFDDRGRLYVTDAAGQNLPAEELLQALPNRILRLEDTDGDGVFDKRTVFADKMTFPMGVLPYRGAVYSCAYPSLWKLEDTDDDGVADKRTELVKGFNSVGNGADIHGPFLGPDGWLYFTKGRHGHNVRQPDGAASEGLASRILRCRPDGTGLETFCGGGMDNPVEIAWSEDGELFFTANIVVPGREGRQDALIHGVYGGVYPWAHESLKEFKRTGDLLPPMLPLGWVAPAGLMMYRSGKQGFGEEYQGNLFTAQFNTRRIQRHTVERVGSMVKAQTATFAQANDPDFHTTDVLEDADGSLLVVNTGGWFRIGCPTSKIAKPEIKGGIYRIYRKRVTAVDDPRGLAIYPRREEQTQGSAELLQVDMTRSPLWYIGDNRFALRDWVADRLSKWGIGSLAALKTVNWHLTPESRLNKALILSRIDFPAAREMIREMLVDQPLDVRRAAIRSVALYRDTKALNTLLELLRSGHGDLAREAATALGRCRSPKSVPALLQELINCKDRFMEHAILYALIEIGNAEKTRVGLSEINPIPRRAALIALDQMDGGNLTPEEVLPLLGTDDEPLRKAALDVIVRRPEWSGAVQALLAKWLADPATAQPRLPALRALLGAFIAKPEIQTLVTQILEHSDTQTPGSPRPVAGGSPLPQPSSILHDLMLLEVIAQAPPSKDGYAWDDTLARHLAAGRPDFRRRALKAIEATGTTKCDAALDALVRAMKPPWDQCLIALGLLVERKPALDDELFKVLTVAWTVEDVPPNLRVGAARVAGRAALTPGQRMELLPAVGRAPAAELEELLKVFAPGGDEAAGRALLEALEASPGLRGLVPEQIRAALAKYPPEVQKSAEPLLQRITADDEARAKRLLELAPALAGGDPVKGKDVFLSAKAACLTCHFVKDAGGRVGPELTTIGAIRAPRDLLESIVFPSASFVRDFQPVVIVTEDEATVTGILLAETPEMVTLRLADGIEKRIPRVEISAMKPGTASIMPGGYDTLLTKDELQDLIAFLMTQR